jgi:IPT/TIG domain-containing protein/PASTA domain-containing protein
MRRRTRALIAVVTALVALFGAAQAQASTVTIGSSLPPASVFVAFFDENGTTVAPLSLSEPGFFRSPVDGRIVRWRVRGASNKPGYAIRVLRPAGEELEFTGAGTSAPATPIGPGIETFETSLPIEAGDYVGLDLPPEGQIGALEGASVARFGPRLLDGETRMGSSFSYGLTFNADVEPAPSVVLISPNSGPIAGGTAVAIAGADFTGVSAVHFGATPATAFTVESERRLTAVAPPSAAAGAVDVTVTTQAGTSAATPDDHFTYIAPPQAAECIVPNLHGKTLKAAKRRIRRADCKLGRVRKARGATAKSGEVVKQRPKAGTHAAAGASVNVTLG